MAPAVTPAVTPTLAAPTVAAAEVAAAETDPQPERPVIGAAVIASWIICATVVGRRNRNHTGRHSACGTGSRRAGRSRRCARSCRTGLKADGLGKDRARCGAGNPVIGITGRILRGRASCQQRGRPRGEANQPQCPERHHSLLAGAHRHQPILLYLYYTMEPPTPRRRNTSVRLAQHHFCYAMPQSGLVH